MVEGGQKRTMVFWNGRHGAYAVCYRFCGVEEGQGQKTCTHNMLWARATITFAACILESVDALLYIQNILLIHVCKTFNSYVTT